MRVYHAYTIFQESNIKQINIKYFMKKIYCDLPNIGRYTNPHFLAKYKSFIVDRQMIVKHKSHNFMHFLLLQ